MPNAAPIGATTLDASAQGTVEGGETFAAMVDTATASAPAEDAPETQKPVSLNAERIEQPIEAKPVDVARVAITPVKPTPALVPTLHILPVETAGPIHSDPAPLPREAMDGVMPVQRAGLLDLGLDAETLETDEADTAAVMPVSPQPVVQDAPVLAAPVVSASFQAVEVAADTAAPEAKASVTVRPLDTLLASKMVENLDQDVTVAQDDQTSNEAQPRPDTKVTAQQVDAGRNADRARNADAAVRSAQTLQSGLEINLPRPAKEDVKSAHTELKVMPPKAVDGQSNAAAMRADAATESLAAKAERTDNGKSDLAPKGANANNANEAVKAPEAKPVAPAPISFDSAEIASAASLETSAPATQSAAHTEQQPVHSQLSLSNIRTTAEMAAHFITKLGQRVARFDMVLTPETMGSVEVAMEVGADGELKARMVFDTPAAANEMRARAEELRRQLAESGFNVSENALEFTDRESDQRGGFQQFMSDGRSGRRAFAGGNRLAEMADAPPPVWTSVSLTPTGVDLKV